MNKYDPDYNPICHEDSAWTRIRTVAGTPVAVRLDNETPTYYCPAADKDQCYQFPVDAPDAALVIINPLSQPAVDEAIKARLVHFENVIGARHEVLDGVVMLKDIGMSWIQPPPGEGPYPPEGEVISLNLTSEETEAQEQEWRDGAEKGYELARRLGVGVTIACSRTGEGVKEAVEDLVAKVLEKRRVDEARKAEERRVEEVKKAEEERRQREARLLAAMPWWKRPIWRTKSQKERDRGG